MPKLRELIRWTKTKIYCQGTVCRRRALAELRTVKLGLTEVGNQAKTVKYSEICNVVFSTNSEQLFERNATDRNTQPTATQQRMT